MRAMKSAEIRTTFLEFFSQRGHQVVPSSSLLPAGDSTLLFANAGMNQFKDVFAGRETRPYTRATSAQKCVRAGGKHNDLENVGYTARHHTFFEMLGNFSFGDYFKREAIRFAWELLVDVYELPLERLWFTVYTDDDDAARLWEEVGAPVDRILRFGEKENFWSMGETGPCGPCSEIHFDRGPEPAAPGRAERVNGPSDDIMEIWNLVFMQYERTANGEMHPLPRPSIDTGAGLERLTMVMQGAPTNYETDLFMPILDAISRLAERPYRPDGELAPAFRVIADHIRAATFLMTDGITPSNEGRGYVLRRIIRRALRYGRTLGFDGAFLYTLVPTVVELMGGIYPEVVARQEVVSTQLRQEEERFARTLNTATDLTLKTLERLKRSGHTTVPGEIAFDLYQTHGIPFEVLEEYAQDEGLHVDRESFERELERERRRGQASWKGDLLARFQPEYEKLVERQVTSTFIGYDQLEADVTVTALIPEEGADGVLEAGASGEAVLDRTPFYAESGGQVGDTGELLWDTGRARVTDTQKPLPGLIVHRVEILEGELRAGMAVTARVLEGARLDTQRNHTATHLLHAALHRVLGPAAQQAGSLVTPERLRFDFSWGEAMKREQLEAVERLVNAEIVRNQPVRTALMPIGEARALGAMALFGEKYGETVRVVTVGDGRFSRELCGGCHVSRTGDIGVCKILSERGVAAGVRRIEAVTGRVAIEMIQAMFREANELAGRYKTSFEHLPEVLDRRDQLLDQLQQEVGRLKVKLALGEAGATETRTRIDDFDVVVRRVPEMHGPDLRHLADSLRQKTGRGVVVLGMEAGGKATILVAVTEDLIRRVPAGALVKELAAIVGGRGGGRPHLAQAGGPHPEKLDEALRAAPGLIEKLAS